MTTSKLRILLLCLIILALTAQVTFAQSVQFQVTAAENQSLYDGPSYSYTARAGAFAGNTFGVVSTSGTWYKLDNGYWMDSRKARQSGSQQSPSGSTAYTNTGANIRNGPSTRNDIVGVVRAGTYAIIYSQSGQWYQVSANGVNGWIYGPLLTFSGPQRYAAPTPRPYIAPTPTSARPSCNGGCINPPRGCNIKGNVSYNTGEKIYHVPGQAYYSETTIDARYGERWFCTEYEAQAAGWRRAYQYIAPVPAPAPAPAPAPTASRPNCNGGCTSPPSGCNIKGNVSYNSGERIYHVPGQSYYYDTVINSRYGERWFCTESEAQAAGWRRAYR